MNSSAEHAIINLSKQKWDWMSARDVAPLDALFHEAAVFVHMGAKFSKEDRTGAARPERARVESRPSGELRGSRRGSVRAAYRWCGWKVSATDLSMVVS
jgi:hypothetical protein